jgi:light-regulated signal transduction histidine kinase (bacteriophytochrome)
LNAELEQRVTLRTAQLEAANKDLEGFSYSVSHDLRAPIRAVNGFCTLLMKDHQAQLDTEAQRKVAVIKGEAERMAALIDDLLAFSRLGRKALQPAEVDMRELASGAYQRLVNGQAQRIDFRIGTLPRATADRSLLEQVWVNLLSNAIKFSGKKDAPVVEVGAIARAGVRLLRARQRRGVRSALSGQAVRRISTPASRRRVSGNGRGSRARASNRDTSRRQGLGRRTARRGRDVSLHFAQGVMRWKSLSR